MTSLMQVHLAGTKGQRTAPIAEDGIRHAKHANVERDRRVEIGNGQNEMVEAINTHER
jgi:hypothetical protein